MPSKPSSSTCLRRSTYGRGFETDLRNNLDSINFTTTSLISLRLAPVDLVYMKHDSLFSALVTVRRDLLITVNKAPRALVSVRCVHNRA